MPTPIEYKFRGGPTDQQVSFVGYDRTITVDTGTTGDPSYTLRVHDGQTPGGFKLLKQISGISGTFKDSDNKTIVFQNGLIISITN